MNKSIKVHIGVTNNLREFRTLNSFTDFCQKEIKYWTKLVELTGVSSYRSLLNVYENIYRSALNVNLELIHKIDSIYSVTRDNPILCSDQEATKYLVSLISKNNNEAVNVFNILINPNSMNIHRFSSYSMQIFVYATSLIANDINNDLTTIKEIRENIKNDIQLLDNEHERFVEEKKKLIDVWYKDTSDRLNDFEIKRSEMETEYKSKYDALELTYLERIKLLAPAKTWENKMKEYSDRGRWWTVGAVVDGVAIFAIVYIFAVQFEKLFQRNGEIASDWILSIKWFLLVGVGVGVLIYLLRFFIKMALSAFHMSRDAEEKGVLTTFYLSLINDRVIDSEKESDLRSIIMTALFARVDTGLLKGDSSPEMPGIVGEITKIISPK